MLAKFCGFFAAVFDSFCAVRWGSEMERKSFVDMRPLLVPERLPQDLCNEALRAADAEAEWGELVKHA